MQNKELKKWVYLSFVLSFLLVGLLIWIGLYIFDKMISLWAVACVTFSLGLFTYLIMRLKRKNEKFLSIMREAVHLCNFNKPLSYDVWKVNDKNDEYVRMVLRKRNLFDGFRTAARNLLITFILMGAYASSTKGIMSTIRSDVLNNPEFLWIVIIAFVFLFWRYYHFAYLRYKYCFEDYVHQNQHSSS